MDNNFLLARPSRPAHRPEVRGDFVPLVLIGMLRAQNRAPSDLSAAQIVASGMHNQHSFDATVARLRRKFRCHRQKFLDMGRAVPLHLDIVAGQIVCIPSTELAALGEALRGIRASLASLAPALKGIETGAKTFQAQVASVGRVWEAALKGLRHAAAELGPVLKTIEASG